MELLLLYLWLKLDAIRSTFGLFMFLCLAVGAAGLFVTSFLRSEASPTTGYGEAKKPNPEYVTAVLWQRRAFKLLLAGLIGFMFVRIVLPTREEAAVIAGAWVVREVVNSDKVKAIASRSVQVIESYLDQYLKDLDPKKKEAAK